jgi:hypothetical protein
MAFIADRETLFDELDDELRLVWRPARSVATTLPEGLWAVLLCRLYEKAGRAVSNSYAIARRFRTAEHMRVNHP